MRSALNEGKYGSGDEEDKEEEMDKVDLRDLAEELTVLEMLSPLVSSICWEACSIAKLTEFIGHPSSPKGKRNLNRRQDNSSHFG